MEIKRPTGSNVLVKKTVSGFANSSTILIPDSCLNFHSCIQTVLMVGPGEVLGNGERENMYGLKPGDQVFSWGGYGFETGEKDCFILDISEISAKLEEIDE